jgi:hypothetical protein
MLSSTLGVTGVDISEFTVEKSSSVSTEEVYCTLVGFDESVGVTRPHEGGLVLHAVSIHHLRVLPVKSIRRSYHSGVVGVERVGEDTQENEAEAFNSHYI